MVYVEVYDKPGFTDVVAVLNNLLQLLKRLAIDSIVVLKDCSSIHHLNHSEALRCWHVL
jgi:hypothetical protein